MGVLKRLTDALEQMGTVEVDEERLQELIDNAESDTINKNTLSYALNGKKTTPMDLLREDEQPHYYIEGSSVDVEGDEVGESITGWDRDRRLGGCYTIVTNQRILVIANHLRGFDEYTIPYDSIQTVSVSDGALFTRLTINTASVSYHLSASKTGAQKTRRAKDYILRQRE